MTANPTVIPAAAADLDQVLGRLQRGADATLSRALGTWWRTSRTPQGPALARFSPVGPDVQVTGWGPGAAWVLDQAPRLLGREDDAEQFTDWVREQRPEWAALLASGPIRIGATDRIAEALAPAIIEQRVTGAEAFSSIRQLIRRFGEPVPGPELLPGHPARALRIPPSGQQWAQIPSWEFVRAGLDRSRAQAVVRAYSRIDALERLLARTTGDATARGEALQAGLCSIPGIGPWTAAQVRQVVIGDPDAWSIDDYHVPTQVARLLGGPQAGPDQAEALLADCRPHRYRVELLVARSPMAIQRHGPRRSLPTHLPTRFDRPGRRRHG